MLVEDNQSLYGSRQILEGKVNLVVDVKPNDVLIGSKQSTKVINDPYLWIFKNARK